MDLHSRWSHRWHNPKVQPFSSKVHGLGAKAKELILKGETVFVYGGIIVPKTEILEYRERLGEIGIPISDDFFLVPTSHEELEVEGIMNHSCEPNVGFKSQIEFVTIKDIQPGEELFLDYAFYESSTDEFICSCGTSQCRGRVTPKDWMKKELQDKYGEFFAPYLKVKFKK